MVGFAVISFIIQSLYVVGWNPLWMIILVQVILSILNKLASIEDSAKKVLVQ